MVSFMNRKSLYLFTENARKKIAKGEITHEKKKSWI
jgi:hypothetical protein